MKDTIKSWLENEVIDLFIGYRMEAGHPLPFVYSKDNLDALNAFTIGRQRYPLEKIATQIAEAQPDIRIGLLARDCNQRALNVLYIWNQVKPDQIRTLSVNCCPSSLKEHGDCSYIEPPTVGAVKKQLGLDNQMETSEVEALDDTDRFERWMYEFEKCIKCYGCRNICPVCFCEECSLEHKELVATGHLPPEVPIFHLVRAVHMAGRCIDCGLCEDACPADIPLRLLYRKVNGVMKDVLGYETGSATERSPFNVLGEAPPLTPKALIK
jgi:ferredoxin